MSKIICDVCGTAYPETATQCPICGCVRSADAQSVATDAAEAAAGSYTYVKGGRFSKANVRKRSRTAQQSPEHTPAPEVNDEEAPAERKTGAGLVATAVILLLAIVAVVIYIALKFFMPGLPAADSTHDTTTTGQTTEATGQTIPCQEIVLDVDTITMENEIGAARMLYATVSPADTTDVLTFASSDEAVVTVSNAGKITVVGPGEAVITVTCGSVSAQCTVICNVEETTEETTGDETTEETTEADEELKLDRKDITFSKKGESWMLYSGSISKSKITWSSDDEKVATIKNGTVVAVGPGTTKVHAEYNGEKASCIIRCSFSDSNANQGVGGTGGVTEDGGSAAPAVISHSDVTLHLSGDKSFSLTLTVNGSPVSVTWTVQNSAVCAVSGNTVTALSAGTTTVSATYNGQTYSCVVRVSA